MKIQNTHNSYKSNTMVTPTLSLYGVKEGEEVRVQLFVVWIAQCSDWQWLQVQQFRGRRELLRENEVAE